MQPNRFDKFDYSRVLGTLMQNMNHKYVDMNRYYNILGQVTGPKIFAYGIMFHQHLLRRSLDRAPGKSNIVGLRIESSRIGSFTNSAQLRNWMLQEGWMRFDGAYFLKMAGEKTWHDIVIKMQEIGLIEINKHNGICSMIPVEGRFLPPVYAYVALLSRFKRDSEIKNMVRDTMEQSPGMIRKMAEAKTKEELVEEVVMLRGENLRKFTDPNYNKEMFRSIVERVQEKFPHKFYRLKPGEINKFSAEFETLSGQKNSEAERIFRDVLQTELKNRETEVPESLDPEGKTRRAELEALKTKSSTKSDSNLPEKSTFFSELGADENAPIEIPAKRKPGRPRKIKDPVNNTEDLKTKSSEKPNPKHQEKSTFFSNAIEETIETIDPDVDVVEAAIQRRMKSERQEAIDFFDSMDIEPGSGTDPDEFNEDYDVPDLPEIVGFNYQDPDLDPDFWG